MRYRDEKFYWTYQSGVHWPNDYLGLDSMTKWIIEKSVGFTDVGLLSSQASARSSVVGNSASSLTAQSAFLNNFENVVNRKVDISEDIKHYQNIKTLSVMHRVRSITV